MDEAGEIVQNVAEIIETDWTQEKEQSTSLEKVEEPDTSENLDRTPSVEVEKEQPQEEIDSPE